MIRKFYYHSPDDDDCGGGNIKTDSMASDLTEWVQSDRTATVEKCIHTALRIANKNLFLLDFRMMQKKTTNTLLLNTEATSIFKGAFHQALKGTGDFGKMDYGRIKAYINWVVSIQSTGGFPYHYISGLNATNLLDINRTAYGTLNLITTKAKYVTKDTFIRERDNALLDVEPTFEHKITRKAEEQATLARIFPAQEVKKVIDWDKLKSFKF